MGMSMAELEGEYLERLPDRNTMSLMDIGSLTGGNGWNFGNNNNFGFVLNYGADGNASTIDQHNSSNDLVTCVIGLGTDGNACHD